MMKKPDFLHIDTDLWKLTIEWKIFGWVGSKMGVATDFRTLRLAVSQEGIYGMN